MDPPQVVAAGLGIALVLSAAAANAAAIRAWVRVGAHRAFRRPVPADDFSAAGGWSIVALLSLIAFFAGLWLTIISLFSFQDVR